MSATTARQSVVSPRQALSRGLLKLLLIVVVVAIDVVLAIWTWSTFSSGLWLIGSVVALIGIGISIGALRARATALRWLLPTLAFMLFFALAPIIYTGYTAFTNYNGTHLLTKQQAIATLERQTFVPARAPKYDWAAYTAGNGRVALFLVPQAGSASAGGRFFVPEGERAQRAVAGTGRFGPADADGFPQTIGSYTRLNPIQKVQQISDISAATYGTGPTTYRVVSASQAATVESRYRIDSASGAVTDKTTGTTYRPTAEGYFQSATGRRINPAFQNLVGFQNLTRLFTDPTIRAPFLGILAWTVVFGVVVVAVQFVIALLYAVVLNSSFVHPVVARIVRSVLLLPYVIPAYLLILIWASLFNQQNGLFPAVLQSMFGLDPSWISTTVGARLAMLFVGVWLGFPYFLLINTGALQSIPGDLLEAASVDGASAWRRFRTIVFPLLMRTIAPLLVLAFAFNFNNFYLAYLLFAGGPPLPGAQVAAGATDLLISFTYKLSFSTGGAEYALAAMVTSLIFVALTPIVLSQLRYYNAWRQED